MNVLYCFSTAILLSLLSPKISKKHLEGGCVHLQVELELIVKSEGR